MPRPECAESAAEAVAGILACADIAVGAIARSAEQQVREMTAEVEARPAEEALRRREHLERLRGELAERAAALALSYGSILDQLGVVDRMLAGEQPGAESPDADADPRVAAIKMTLRERRRVHALGEVPIEGADAPPVAAEGQPALPEVQPVPGGPWVVQQQAAATDDVWPPPQTAQAPPQAWPAAPPAWQAEQTASQAWQVPQVASAPPPPPPVQPEVQAPPRRLWRLWQRAA